MDIFTDGRACNDASAFVITSVISQLNRVRVVDETPLKAFHKHLILAVILYLFLCNALVDGIDVFEVFRLG